MLRTLLASFAGVALLAAAPSSTHAANPAEVVTPQVRAELVAHAPEGVQAGKPLWLGLLIEHKPQWHTYWKNPGDSGLPTTLAWTLPAGLQAGEIDWPTPHKLPVGPLMNYGYDGRVLLPVPVQVNQASGGNTLQVLLKADWLVCKDVCIPESGEFRLDLPVQAATAAHGPLFEAAWAARPQELATAKAQARPQGQQLQLEVQGLPAAWQGQALAFWPEVGGVIAHAAPMQAQWSGERWIAQVPLDPQRSESPAVLPAVLTREGQPGGVRLAVSVSGPWPAVAATPALATPAPSPAAANPAAPSLTWGLSLLLALAGGALLNLMPCVFPVLSLKVFGFAAHAGERRALLLGGLAYTVGVVASFVALGALVLGLRAGGEQLGWGFQLQSPLFVALLALLFTLIGLNLAGVFEFGNLLPARWTGLRARHPVVDSALTGMLAVAVASPCTAPFMGASLGAALSLPAAQALLVFAALGLGMALPYLVLSAWPALAQRLPRPGAWMARFKALMAFPMFATVVWLVWVLGQQNGIDSVASVLGLAVALALAAWAWGLPGASPGQRLGLGLPALLLLAAVASWAWPSLKTAEAAAEPAAVASSASSASATTAPGADWQAWSPEAVAEHLRAGRPVFVDFTAAWCVTCQYNKRGALAAEAVKAAFRARNVALLRADWTRRDPRISAELARMGRGGVPVYALHSPGAAAPQLLSEVLSVDEVVQAVSAVAAPR